MEKTSLNIDENIVSLLCYIGLWVTGLIFLLLEKENKTVKFHAKQSLFLFLPLTIIAPVIGWIGSPTTAKFLLTIENVIKKALNEKSKFIIIGAKLPAVFERCSVESWTWSLEAEIDLIHKLDIGVMPLVDTPFERGKCGYKLIQYMACGLPVIASPVGINKKIVRHGENGFLAGNEHEWIEAITMLQNNPLLRKEMGSKGRKMVEENYALQVNAPKIVNILNQIK